MTTLRSKEGFTINYHSTQRAGNNNYGFYALHNVDISIETVLGWAFYQTAQSYRCGDIQCPTNWLEISEDGTDERLVRINALYESDFDDANDEINEVCEELEISHSELREIYLSLMDLNNDAQTFLEEYLEENKQTIDQQIENLWEL